MRAVPARQWRDHRALDSALHGVGTTLVQWDALRSVDAAPGASGHELAERTFMSDQAFATLAARLLTAGLVERRPGGGRRQEHHLTDEGLRVLAAGARVVDETLAVLFAPLDADERHRLQVLLDALVERSGADPGQ